MITTVQDVLVLNGNMVVAFSSACRHSNYALRIHSILRFHILCVFPLKVVSAIFCNKQTTFVKPSQIIKHQQLLAAKVIISEKSTTKITRNISRSRSVATATQPVHRLQISQ